MEFVYGHLADYAAEGANGKLTMVGVFESILVDATRPISLPRFYVVARFRAHVTEGTQQTVEIRFTDADGKNVVPPGRVTFGFAPEGPRRPLRGQMIVEVAGLKVPDVGDYAWHFFVNGTRVGEVPLSVLPNPRAPTPRAGSQVIPPPRGPRR